MVGRAAAVGIHTEHVIFSVCFSRLFSQKATEKPQNILKLVNGSMECSMGHYSKQAEDR